MRGASKIELDTRGSILAGTGVAMLLVGLLLVDGLLLALGLVMILITGLAWGMARWNLQRLGLELDGPPMVRAGEAFRLRVALINQKKWMPTVDVNVAVFLPKNQTVEVAAPWLGARSEAANEMRVTAAHRGSLNRMTYRMVSGFPLGLWRVSRSADVAHSLKVLPRALRPQPWEWLGRFDEADGGVVSVGQPCTGMLRGLREFHMGDRGRSIAWSASLRWQASGRGTLMVKDWDPPGNQVQRWEILFHSYGGNGALIRPDRFEMALSLAWGWVEHFFDRGVEVMWRADFDEWMPRRVRTRSDLGKLGEALAAAQRRSSTEQHELEARLAEVIPGEALIVSDMPGHAWPGPWHDDQGLRVIDGDFGGTMSRTFLAAGKEAS